MIKNNCYPTHKIKVLQNIEVTYRDEGDGDVVLLFVHGLATNLSSWDLTIPDFVEKYRCIALNLPVVDEGEYRDYEGKLSFYAELIVALLNKLGISRVHLIGHSMGGQISIITTLNYPSLVDRLILLAPAGFETFSEAEKLWVKNLFRFDAVFKASEEQIRRNYSLNFYEIPIEVEPLILARLALRNGSDYKKWCANMIGNISAMLEEPVFDQLARIEQSTLVIYGEEDQLIPNPLIHASLSTKLVAEKGCRNMRDSQLRFIPKCGHLLQFEKPTIVNELLSLFLSGDTCAMWFVE